MRRGMAKYIEREKLPQFQYYNSCGGENFGWSFDSKDAWAKVDGRKFGLKDPSLLMALSSDIRDALASENVDFSKKIFTK